MLFIDFGEFGSDPGLGHHRFTVASVGSVLHSFLGHRSTVGKLKIDRGACSVDAASNHTRQGLDRAKAVVDRGCRRKCTVARTASEVSRMLKSTGRPWLLGPVDR